MTKIIFILSEGVHDVYKRLSTIIHHFFGVLWDIGGKIYKEMFLFLLKEVIG